MSIRRGSFFWLARLTTCVSKRQRLSFRPVGPHAARPAQRQIHFSLRATCSLCQPEGHLADRPGDAASFFTRCLTIGSPCLLGRSPALPLAPSLLAPHPMSQGVAFAVGAQLLVGRLDGRNNSHRHVRNFRRVTVKRGVKTDKKLAVCFQRDWVTL